MPCNSFLSYSFSRISNCFFDKIQINTTLFSSLHFKIRFFIQLKRFFFTTFFMFANVPLLLLILCSFLIHNDTVIWEPSCIWSFQPSVQPFNFRKWMVFLWRKLALLVHKRMHKLVWKWSVGKLTTTWFQQVW